MAFDPADISRRIRALGKEIAPQSIEGTAAIYAPFQEVEPYRGVTVSRDLKYGADERHRLDVFRAQSTASAPAPVILFIHGGGFVGGDKRNPGSPYNDNVALWAVRHGLIGVNMTYRFAPQYPWPAGTQDVAAAVAWVRENIGRHGGDPRRIILLGTSAGAAHAASYVAHPQLQPADGPGIAGAVLLSGIYDLTASEPNPFQVAYYGADMEGYRRASMVDGLVASDVPLFFVLTEMDPPIFHQQTLKLLQQWMARHGEWPYFMHMTAHNHLSSTMHMNSPDGSLGERILDFIASRCR
ncbi:MAG TPA: alpha/beta hydrolase [Steroidobacteraceae bacterium]|nr:alpha/beta hydrolase [Steroidobacteraceae bacterium]